LNRLPNALQSAEKAVSLDAEAVLPKLLCGEIALKMGNSDLAFEFSRQALASQPFNEGTVLFQVKVLEFSNRGDEGLALLEKSITPDSTIQMVLAYARLVYQLRGPQAALPMLKKIVQTDPDEVGVLNLLAHAQEECGEMENAEQTAFKALQLQPNQADLNRLMGRLKRMSGQLDQSVHFLSEAIRQNPADMDAYIELGKTYQDRREMAQAMGIYEKAIEADPSDHRPYYLAGIVLRESKDYQGAEKMLKRASELAPQDVNIRRLLGAVVTLNLIHSSQEVGSLNETH
jgi:tetratricopeptide (TPR) repeat protein